MWLNNYSRHLVRKTSHTFERQGDGIIRAVTEKKAFRRISKKLNSLKADREVTWATSSQRRALSISSSKTFSVFENRRPPDSFLGLVFGKRTMAQAEGLVGAMGSLMSNSSPRNLENLNFDNKVLKALPYDNSTDPRVRREVPRACFTKAQPSPVENPETVAYSSSALALLDLPESEAEKEDFAEYFSGSKLLPGSDPSAHCYCGHQFGYFSGQLGDGAAMYLGEIVNSRGERWELQLKGSGPTPFSRQADGRKVLRSSIREFLCSEAMHSLGIPTTRSGSCVTSDTRIVRDIFYDGNPIMEQATIITRIAPTFMRFGSFEIFNHTDRISGRKGPSAGHTDILHRMLKYTIESFFPEIHNKYPENRTEKYAEFYKDVVLRTARLVAEWQCVGFCHGVLNTDNMSILGLTIDYGPFGFLDYYDPDHICNTSDDGGRYAYQNQPSICKWNLQKFAEAIQQALPLSQSQEILKIYDDEFQKAYLGKMRKKLGLVQRELEGDRELVAELFETMRETRADFTNTFRYMSQISVTKESEERDEEILTYLHSQCQSAEDLKKSMQTTSTPQQVQMMLMMLQSHPSLLEQLGDGAVRQLKRELEKLEKQKEIEDMTEESKMAKDIELWRIWIEKFRERLTKEFEGMGDAEKMTALSQRIKVMDENNPRIVLRNYIAQHVIEAAEKGSYREVRTLLKLLESPYTDIVDESNLTAMKDNAATESSNADNSIDDYVRGTETSLTSLDLNFYSKVPDWASGLKVT